MLANLRHAGPAAPAAPSGGRSGLGRVAFLLMKLLRQLEMRIESLLDGAAGMVFRGPLHPLELASRLLREADLHTREGSHGPVAPNQFLLQLPVDKNTNDEEIGLVMAELERLVDAGGLERGWRMAGTTTVRFQIEPGLGQGSIRCTVGEAAGPRSPWSRLRGDQTLDVCVNQAVLGRDQGADVVVANDTTSRAHALIWTVSGQTFVKDLGSANGTAVNGARIGGSPVELVTGSILVLGEAGFRFEDLINA